jgi:hypothetical protein
LAQREGIDTALEPPLRQAMLQVGLQTRRALVAFLGRLGEQFQDDVSEWLRQWPVLTRRSRLQGYMAVDPTQCIVSRKG